jgi:hypothetical protein
MWPWVFECRKMLSPVGMTLGRLTRGLVLTVFLWEHINKVGEYSRKVPGVAGRGIGPTHRCYH